MAKLKDSSEQISCYGILTIFVKQWRKKPAAIHIFFICTSSSPYVLLVLKKNPIFFTKYKEVCKSTGKEFKLSKEVRVVVSTLITSVSMSLRGITFTHIFVDEAGQATEPEVLIALFWKMRRQGGSWVLAGDPHQLGPVIQAELAQKMGLQRSLLTRLMTDFDIYKPDPETGEYDARYVTKLVRNFRSHATILEVYCLHRIKVFIKSIKSDDFLLAFGHRY